MVHLAVRLKRSLTMMSVFALREELVLHHSPACCTLCCELFLSNCTTGRSLFVSTAFFNVQPLPLGSLHSDGWTGFRLRRLYFVWVCRELQSFYWFAELLCAVHHKVRTKATRCCLLLTFTQDVWEPKLTLQVQLDCLGYGLLAR